ncbi:helix-turn-helix transcriptional regulator [Halorhodospira halophila]|uniref:helix-turn-helix transcriptional regulator n=1 Tax=Halorhodospira halophila TaxID=1053 RepID=UPI001911F0FE|nr:AlpA family transcriptional regulator [Halorhodospira halophila]MBK5937167.1 hypothetical protein [Halorhodospira halophila]
MSARNDQDRIDRIIRVREVLHLTGYSRSGLYTAMRRGDFPQGVKLGPRATGWRETEVREWLESRPSIYGDQ